MTHQVRPSINRRSAAAGFTLLELMVAIGILGIGLIMVSAIFPVALSQHKDSIERMRATELITKARAIIRTKFDGSKLWVHPAFIPGAVPPSQSRVGEASPWYMLPMANLTVGNTSWDAMLVNVPNASGIAYADALNGALGGNLAWGGIVVGTDMLSDRSAPYPDELNEPNSPFTDSQFQEAPNRFVSLGLYRWLADGTPAYAAAICKQSRGDVFVQQDLSVGAFLGNASNQPSDLRRLPVPWRVVVQYDRDTNPNRLFGPAADDEGLGEIAPPGSKILIGGHSWVAQVGTYGPATPAGRVLTVTSVFDDATSPGLTQNNPNQPYKPLAIEVLEDISDLPGLHNSPYPVAFDVWVFPPPIVGTDNGTARFGAESPLMEWKMNL